VSEKEKGAINMNPLLGVTLFWGILFTAMVLFGIACIKFGVYTSGNKEDNNYLEV